MGQDLRHGTAESFAQGLSHKVAIKVSARLGFSLGTQGPFPVPSGYWQYSAACGCRPETSATRGCPLGKSRYDSLCPSRPARKVCCFKFPFSGRAYPFLQVLVIRSGSPMIISLLINSKSTKVEP